MRRMFAIRRGGGSLAKIMSNKDIVEAKKRRDERDAERTAEMGVTEYCSVLQKWRRTKLSPGPDVENATTLRYLCESTFHDLGTGSFSGRVTAG